MGRKLVLTGVTFVGSDAPTLVAVDPIESSGSLILIEPGHPAGPLVGVPGNGDVATNLFADTALGLLGSAGHGAWAISDLSAGKGLIERSTKGGVHYVTSRSLGSSGMFAKVNLADDLKTYLRANDTHHYYLSTWAKKTRVEVSSGNSLLHGLTTTGSPSSNYIVYQTEAGGSGAGSGGALGAMNRNLGNQRASVHGTGWAGTKPASNASFNAVAFGAGFTILNASALQVANWVIYRCYLEDLTVSGRSHTEVDALDLALYTAEVLTVGGRYQGDTTPTDPATVV
jgi:hypothetical protein